MPGKGKRKVKAGPMDPRKTNHGASNRHVHPDASHELESDTTMDPTPPEPAPTLRGYNTNTTRARLDGTITHDGREVQRQCTRVRREPGLAPRPPPPPPPLLLSQDQLRDKEGLEVISTIRQACLTVEQLPWPDRVRLLRLLWALVEDVGIKDAGNCKAPAVQAELPSEMRFPCTREAATETEEVTEPTNLNLPNAASQMQPRRPTAPRQPHKRLSQHGRGASTWPQRPTASSPAAATTPPHKGEAQQPGPLHAAPTKYKAGQVRRWIQDNNKEVHILGIR